MIPDLGVAGISLVFTRLNALNAVTMQIEFLTPRVPTNVMPDLGVAGISLVTTHTKAYIHLRITIAVILLE